MNIEEFREDIFLFAKVYMSIELRPHQLNWLEKIHFGGKRVLVMAPRGHGKSTITLIYILWRICKDPDIKILMASHVESLAREKARMVQRFLELPTIQEAFDFQKGKPWSIFTFYLGGKIEPVMTTVAARGGMVGKRFDIIVFDDLLSIENQLTPTNRARIMDWIMQDVIPAIDPTEKEKVIVIGTRKHPKDWYSELLENDMYSKVTDVAFWTDEAGVLRYLWPERFTREVLDMRLREMGPRRFAQEFLNQVTPHEGMLLKREWIQYFDELPPKHCLSFSMGVDPAYGSEEEGASSLAVAVIAYDTRPGFKHIYVVELFKEQMSQVKQEEKIQQLYQKWQPVSTNIERGLIDSTLSDRMVANTPGAQPIDYIHTRLKGTSEVAKINRIISLLGYYFELNMISLKNPAYDEPTRDFIESEYIEFPDGDKDLLDALNLAVDLVEFHEILEGALVWTPR